MLKSLAPKRPQLEYICGEIKPTMEQLERRQTGCPKPSSSRLQGIQKRPNSLGVHSKQHSKEQRIVKSPAQRSTNNKLSGAQTGELVRPACR